MYPALEDVLILGRGVESVGEVFCRWLMVEDVVLGFGVGRFDEVGTGGGGGSQVEVESYFVVVVGHLGERAAPPPPCHETRGVLATLPDAAWGSCSLKMSSSLSVGPSHYKIFHRIHINKYFPISVTNKTSNIHYTMLLMPNTPLSNTDIKVNIPTPSPKPPKSPP